MKTDKLQKAPPPLLTQVYITDRGRVLVHGAAVIAAIHSSSLQGSSRELLQVFIRNIIWEGFNTLSDLK